MESTIVYFNSATQPFGDHTAAIQLNRWAVYNAPRPIPGEIAFQGEFRHGIFYAAGPLDRYARAWDELDAWPVELISNMEIVDRLAAMASARNTTLAEVLEYTDLPEFARQCGFPWHDTPPSPSDQPIAALATRT